VIERACALHRPEGESLRERAVAAVEIFRGAAQNAVRVGVLLEHAQDDLVRRLSRGHRNPRRNSS